MRRRLVLIFLAALILALCSCVGYVRSGYHYDSYYDYPYYYYDYPRYRYYYYDNYYPYGPRYDYRHRYRYRRW